MKYVVINAINIEDYVYDGDLFSFLKEKGKQVAKGKWKVPNTIKNIGYLSNEVNSLGGSLNYIYSNGRRKGEEYFVWKKEPNNDLGVDVTVTYVKSNKYITVVIED